MNFFEHAINGEDTETFPKWGGTEPISTSLSKTKQALGTPSNSVALTNKCDSTDLNGQPVFQFADMQNLQLSESSYSELSPEFVSQFDQSYHPGTMIDKINIEYATYIEGGKAQLKQLDENKDVLTNTELSDSLGSIQTQFSNIGDLLESASDSLATNFVDLQVKFSDYILLGFNVIFGVFLGISVITLVCLSLYVWLKVFALKYIIHVMWNLSMLILFIGLLIGSILGIISSVSKQLSPVMSYLLSPAYISSPNSVISTVGNTGEMLNICLNKDGDLRQTMEVDETEEKFDDYYESSSYLGKIYENLTMSKMEGILTAQNYINGLKNDIGSIKVKENQKLSEYLQNDFNDNCSPLQVNSLSESLPCTSYSSSCLTACQELRKLMIDINQLHSALNQPPTSQNNFFSKFSGTLDCLQAGVGNYKDDIDKINNALNPILGGESSFLSLFNCNFIKEDIIRFCDRFSNHFYNSTLSMFVCCTLTGFWSYIGIYFLLPSMYRFSQEARAPETELEPAPENKEETPADAADSASVKPMIYSKVDVESKEI